MSQITENYTEEEIKEIVHSLLKAFIIISGQVDEDTPPYIGFDVPVDPERGDVPPNVIDENSNSITIALGDEPAPETEYQEMPTTLHYHQLYASTLLYHNGQMADVEENYQSTLEHIGHHYSANEFPEIVLEVMERLNGEHDEDIDYKENLLTVVRAFMLLDARITHLIVEEELETFTPFELNTFWADAILGSEEVSEAVKGIFEESDPLAFKELAEDFPEEPIAMAWNMYESLTA